MVEGDETRFDDIINLMLGQVADSGMGFKYDAPDRFSNSKNVVVIRTCSGHRR
jgi:hypothetical protein